MKKLYIYLIVLVLGIYSCKTDEIDTYGAGNYLQFTTLTTDTVDISFMMLGSPATYDYPLEIRHIGMPSATETKPFKMVVVDTSTTIKAGMYTLPELSFQPWSKLDTFFIKLTSYPELETTKVLLCLELQDNEYFTVGDRDYRRVYLRIHNDVSNPSWWGKTNSDVSRYLLGAYSDAKYRALVRAVKERIGDVDMISTPAWNTIRLWALEFKQWSKEHPEVTEADGTPFSIPVVE